MLYDTDNPPATKVQGAVTTMGNRVKDFFLGSKYAWERSRIQLVDYNAPKTQLLMGGKMYDPKTKTYNKTGPSSETLSFWHNSEPVNKKKYARVLANLWKYNVEHIDNFFDTDTTYVWPDDNAQNPKSLLAAVLADGFKNTLHNSYAANAGGSVDSATTALDAVIIIEPKVWQEVWLTRFGNSKPVPQG